MAGTIAFFGVMGFLSSISGGLNASKQQTSIENNFCNLSDTISKYKSIMMEEDNILSMEASLAKTQATELGSKLADLTDTIRIQHAQFKKIYVQWTVIGIIFLIMLIFILVSKKYILGATTEAK